MALGANNATLQVFYEILNHNLFWSSFEWHEEQRKFRLQSSLWEGSSALNDVQTVSNCRFRTV